MRYHIYYRQCEVVKTLLYSPTKFELVIRGLFKNELFLGFALKYNIFFILLSFRNFFP